MLHNDEMFDSCSQAFHKGFLTGFIVALLLSGGLTRALQGGLQRFVGACLRGISSFVQGLHSVRKYWLHKLPFKFRVPGMSVLWSGAESFTFWFRGLVSLAFNGSVLRV